MATIATLLKKVKALDPDKVSEEAMTLCEKPLAAKQRQQMLVSENNQGEKIGRYRNPSYRRMKEAMNPAAKGFVDLKLTGDFYKGVYAEVRGNKVIVDSTDEKTEALDKKYPNIFGLNANFKPLFIKEDLRPVFNQVMSDATGLPFKK